MPINGTVTDSGMILLQETIIKLSVLIGTLVASRFLSKVYHFFTWAVTDYTYSILTGHTKNSKSNGFNKSNKHRLSESVTKFMYSSIM